VPRRGAAAEQFAARSTRWGTPAAAENCYYAQLFEIELPMDNASDRNPPDYDHLSDDFYALKCVVTPAEYHGLVAGRLVVARLVRGPHWDDQNLEYLGLPLTARGSGVERILGLSEQTAAELEANDFSFRMLLPGDDLELAARVEALGNWCQGFLVGLALGGLDQPAWSSLQPDLAEGLLDMAAVAQIEVDDQGTEDDYEHLCEYVRMVVLNVYAELMLAEGDAAAAPPANVVAGLFGGRGRLH